ncbi:MAG: TIGR03545 family protein, partial [Bdellovibrionales bacterium]|nr:TIGR03545 family protein [Bdellovibrionales bacterium]
MAEKTKKPKNKGPIRFEAIVPIALVCLGVGAYFTLLFDWHLRLGIQYGATLANGAEVNVGYLRTSFWNATFKMGEIQVTNPEQPERNRVSVGGIHLDLLWDALLRGKVVIPTAGITNIALNTARSSPGRVLPKDS